MRQRYEGRFFGRRVNCEYVPMFPASVARRVLDDPRKIPYLLIWRIPRDGGIGEAVRVKHLRHAGLPSQFPEADLIEIKRTDGTVTYVRVSKRPLPRNGGVDALLICPVCCTSRRALYGWKPGGRYTTSVKTAPWQCRQCARLRFASEGGALLIRSRGHLGRLFGVGHSARPDQWYPLVFASPNDARLV
jgi:hypothetical protein